MSELKPFIGPHPTNHTLTEYYLKSEADKVIAELKNKIKLYEDLGSCKKGCPALRHNQRRVESEMYKVELKEKEIADLEENHKKEVEQLLILNREQANAANRLRDSMERVIRHHKYKRCLAMALWCESKVYHIRRTPLCDMSEHEYWQYEDEFWQRWQNRWQEIAEKFKEVK